MPISGRGNVRNTMIAGRTYCLRQLTSPISRPTAPFPARPIVNFYEPDAAARISRS